MAQKLKANCDIDVVTFLDTIKIIRSVIPPDLGNILMSVDPLMLFRSGDRRTDAISPLQMTNWLFFMNAGVGPMQGQSNHFTRYAPEQIEYGINRYQNETRRLYGVLDKHLKDAGTEYLVGNKCTIADIAHW